MITIDWAAFGIVLGVAFVAAVGIAVFYALSLRLLAVGSPDDGAIEHGRRPLGATLGAAVCLAICVATVLFGLWLIIPQIPKPWE
jgi:hypothetical protein